MRQQKPMVMEIRYPIPYTYDDRGNKLSEVYANGAKKTYECNRRNLVTKTQSYDKEGTKTLTSRYHYDDKGQLSEMTDHRVSAGTEMAYRYTEYSYDTRGRIIAFAEISQNAQQRQMGCIPDHWI